jgi:RNA polymerase sigma-70 factor (ECF subfamily)
MQNLDAMTEIQLVRAAAARDPLAVATLYGAHFGPLQRRALAITGCHQDAADAAQDALLDTFDRLPKLDPDTLCFGAYSTTATRREALKLRRVIAEPVDEHGHADDPYTHAERAELRRRVRGAVRALPERQRRAIFRADFEQVDRKDIAAELGPTENATGQLLFRARRNLQSSLAAS